MDYKAFYDDVVEWIQQANQAAVKYGIHSESFWKWVTDSAGELCGKYENNQLAIKQMMMLTEWLEGFYEKTGQKEDVNS